ncbi:protein-(glutamine-N5) methyltransferase, release factor-specific [Actinobacillus succinogenes]|uniref:Release factor glutamine methyltransferase n=1 Tax=Actinobacillus succinogenes (strain ATCC 55618 / DSM 22257 / CCUG 43843 / 130Z) TaxID=339671 RepID=A6VP97_ACTSZ|nr:peptide chain release factor N(5)-glutamine methyltransferase [Actinobacillus succinogenes]ABR74794.1 modification methylase, HemK family [Actinobacillus succinogenes 130Z]PHI41272.1 protein-(glutamine-N5) methyltransferase, release factor-specific [Actinobacillus succinogenes]
MNYADWLAYASRFLSQNLKNDPYLNAKFDANLLLQSVTQKTKSQIIAFSDTVLDEKTLQNLTALLNRRATGEPVAYILGETEFWTLSLKVSPHTLIPRPDTEILVERALERIPLKDGVSVLDLGTGTGAIALSLAKELKKRGQKYWVLGVDLMPEAVVLAQRNAERNQLDDVEFRRSSWFNNIHETFDLVVSNPPYIDADDAHLTQGDVRFEPLSALIAEEQGYADLRHIIEQTPRYLNPQGWLLLEHGWRQGEKVRSFFDENLWEKVATVKDYGDNERVTLAKLR